MQVRPLHGGHARLPQGRARQGDPRHARARAVGLWELRVMRLNWGETPVEEIARMLRREPGTVAEKGRAIGLDQMVRRRMRGE